MTELEVSLGFHLCKQMVNYKPLQVQHMCFIICIHVSVCIIKILFVQLMKEVRMFALMTPLPQNLLLNATQAWHQSLFILLSSSHSTVKQFHILQLDVWKCVCWGGGGGGGGRMNFCHTDCEQNFSFLAHLPPLM